MLQEPKMQRPSFMPSGACAVKVQVNPFVELKKEMPLKASVPKTETMFTRPAMEPSRIIEMTMPLPESMRTHERTDSVGRLGMVPKGAHEVKIFRTGVEVRPSPRSPEGSRAFKPAYGTEMMSQAGPQMEKKTPVAEIRTPEPQVPETPTLQPSRREEVISYVQGLFQNERRVKELEEENRSLARTVGRLQAENDQLRGNRG